ncbi:hypothetical protein SAMN02746098_03916 [Desulfosporosinus lacus DSM 15449]|uniref:Uncharacterized protein n=1 Tax=Desulfosporosinus lacus DSM 15449 TaxID=1121420 RepID=A0A1M6A857_9FIRM|nr:hypothetical protein SAMN02746098_03916 [Desulfosporosinus lacus DSM 15449]
MVELWMWFIPLYPFIFVADLGRFTVFLTPSGSFFYCLKHIKRRDDCEKKVMQIN